MELPIIYKLKRKTQKELAELQDEVIEVVYELLDSAVIHGGTAIWRCYDGKRFSEDIDLYARYTENFKARLEQALKRRDLSLIKFRQTENTLFSEVSNGASSMRLEITKERKKGSLAVYKKANGNTLDVLTLKPEELILEKLAAYNSRRRIRDIYDVYFLSRLVSDIKIRKIIKGSLKKMEKPVDKEDLKAIIYEGEVPTFEEMLERLSIWVR